MKVGKQFKVEAAVSDPKENHLESMRHVTLQAIEPGKYALVAMDGYILAVVPCEAEQSEIGPITPQALKEARKSKADKHMAEIQCNGALSIPNGATYQRPDLPPFPDWRKVLPHHKPENSFSVGLNTRFLSRLADALGHKELILTFDKEKPDSRPVEVKTAHAPEVFGVIMPIRVK